MTLFLILVGLMVVSVEVRKLWLTDAPRNYCADTDPRYWRHLKLTLWPCAINS